MTLKIYKVNKDIHTQNLKKKKIRKQSQSQKSRKMLRKNSRKAAKNTHKIIIRTIAMYLKIMTCLMVNSQCTPIL